MLKGIFKIFGKTRLFTPLGIYFILSSLSNIGVNLFAILRISSKLYPNEKALFFKEKGYTYQELYTKANNLRYALVKNKGLKKGQKAAFFCRNSPSFILSLFAISGLGLDIYLLNYGQQIDQFSNLMERYQFDFIIYDKDIKEYIIERNFLEKSLSTSQVSKYLDLKLPIEFKYNKCSFNRIIVLTSGTTGISSAVSRRASVSNYLSPLIDISTKLGIWNYKSLYIAPPIYHGFGLVALLISFILGKEVYIHEQFDTTEAINTIQKNQIEAIALVPIMLQRIVDQEISSLKSLRCIISGGAKLPELLTKDIQNYLGSCVYNLYGTSEAGVCIIATPSDLKYSSKTIGKPLSGVKVKITNQQNEEVARNTIGQISIQCGWSVKPNEWIKTGDIGYVDNDGYYFYVGRIDDMIISGGENMYPSELEDILRTHPSVKDVVVKGIDDKYFGQRLKAFIVLIPNSNINNNDILAWLKNRSYKYQIPKEIEIIDYLPTNTIMKIDKNKLV